jgi:TP901 family phage tail tape measure protein
MAGKEATVGKLNIRIGIDLNEFNKNMKQFQREMKKTERSLEGFKILGRQLKSVGATLTASLTIPIVGLGIVAKKSFDSVDEALDSIAIATGATGKALDGLQTSAKKVGSQVPNDLKPVGEVIGVLNTYLGATGTILEDLTKKIALATHMSGEDAPKAAQSMSRAVNKWGLDAKNASKFVDQLFLASQKFGIGITKLSDQLSYFQVPLSQMGFSLVESTVLLGQFEKNGVNAEQVLSSMSRAMANFAKVGIADTAGAFDTITKKIKEAKTESEAAAIALKVFGTRAGPQLAAEIRAGRFEINELVEEFHNVGKVIESTFEETADSAEILAAAKNALTIALEPLGREIDKLARVLLPPLITALADLTQRFDKLSQPVKTAIVLVLAFVAAIGPILTIAGFAADGVMKLVVAFQAIKAINWKGLIGNFGAFSIALLKNTALIAMLVGSISGFVNGIKKLKDVPDDVDSFWEGFMYSVNNIKDGFVAPFKWVADQFMGLFDELGDAEQSLLENSLDKLNKNLNKSSEVDLSKLFGDGSKDSKLEQAAAEKGKSAGEVFSQAFNKTWDELWEMPYNLGDLGTLEKQLNQLKYISSQAEERIRKTLIAEGHVVYSDDNIWAETVESSQAFAQVWDRIFETQRQITEKQIKLIKAEGLSPANTGRIINLLEHLKPVALTSQAQLTLDSMRSEIGAESVSERFSEALDEFKRYMSEVSAVGAFEDKLSELIYESSKYAVEMKELLIQLKNTSLASLGTSDTAEIKQIEKAISDRLALYDEEIAIGFRVRTIEATENLTELLERVSKLSRDELQKYWDEAKKLAEIASGNTEETIEEIDKIFQQRDLNLRIQEWFVALDDMADVIGRFNQEAGDSVRSFRDIIDVLHRLPEITANLQTSFGEMIEGINKAFEPYLGKNYVGQLFGAASGMQMFGQGSSGGTNWVGSIAGSLAGAGFMTPLTGAIAIGSQLVNEIFPGKSKDSGAEQLQKQINEYNKILDEWGAEFRSDNLSFERDSGFLGWRNLFGNQVWSAVGEDAARLGMEIAEQIIASMQDVFNTLAGGAFDALFNLGGLESLSQSVGQSLQNALMGAILNTAAIKEPMQRLSAYIAEAVQDGLTSAELEHITAMTGEIWESLEPYEDIAKEIAEQFGLAEDSAKGIGAALRNVPQGFKIALERFTAASGIQANAVSNLESNRTQIVIQGDVYGMDDFERKVEESVDKSERRRRTRNYGVWAGAY